MELDVKSNKILEKNLMAQRSPFNISHFNKTPYMKTVKKKS